MDHFIGIALIDAMDHFGPVQKKLLVGMGFIKSNYQTILRS